MYLRWKAVQSVVAVQTHTDMFTAFVQVSEESSFTPQGQVHPVAWAEVTESVRWDVSCTSCATAYSEPLALTEGRFFVRQSFTEIHCGWISLFIPSPTPISVWILPTFLLGPSPVSNKVRNLLAWRPLVQIQTMLIWPRRKNDPLADHSIKCTFYLVSSGHQGQLYKQILLVLAQKWKPELLVGFRWRLVLHSHEFIEVLTVIQVFLQFG